MRRFILALTCIALLAAPTLFALTAGTDILVPAAGRSGLWRTDLYVFNPGVTTVGVTVYWLVRDQANPNPMSINLSLGPGETAVLDDVILNDFGLATGFGAIRVVADGKVIVNSRIFAVDGPLTYGQGSEGVPAWAATQAGQSTDVVGLTQGFGFRSNVYAQAGADGATIEFSLHDPDGDPIAKTAVKTITLGIYEPYLKRVDRLFSGVANFRDGTLHAVVTSGSAVIGASKADNGSDDPTTLESEAAGAPLDGTYQISLYDLASFAAGGNIVIQDGQVTAINGTYFNYDKLDGVDPACPVIFLWGLGLPGPTDLEDFLAANGGVTFEDSYESSDSGVMTWTVEFEVDDNMELTGTVTAQGSDFPVEESGCNGAFPALTLIGGRSN